MNKRLKKNLLLSLSLLLFASAGGIATSNHVNVHADSYTDGMFAEADKLDKPGDKAYNDYINNGAREHPVQADAYALAEMKSSDLQSYLYHDSQVRNYLHSKGYSDQQIRKAYDGEKDLEESDTEANEKHPDNGKSDPLTKAQKHAVALAKKEHVNFVDLGDLKANDLGKQPTSNAESRRDAKQYRASVAKYKVSKRTHVSKATVKKLMKRIALDKKYIKFDKKQLSKRNAKKFMKNYKKVSKSLKGSKRTKAYQRATKAEKRLLRNRSNKRYAKYYQDLVKREKDLTKLLRSNHASKSTKRHARKSLKRVRKTLHKNRKTVKKARHKIARHHRR